MLVAQQNNGEVADMINRGFAIHKMTVRFLIAGGLLIGSHGAFSQEPAKDAATPTAQEAPAVVAAPTAAEILQGQNLFEGIIRLENGGPPCNSCHHVQNDAVIGGGVLARELTTAFSRMGAEGITAMIPRNGSESPFPVMQAAFQGKEITENEVHALVAFLQNADKQNAFQKPSNYERRMFFAGCAGVVVMLIFFWLVGHGRKKRSVNSDIYDRQLKSADIQ